LGDVLLHGWVLRYLPFLFLVFLLLCGSARSVPIAVRAATQASPVSITSHPPILIDGDSNFTAANGVVSGTGVAADPYVIANWSIAPYTAGYAVEIRKTRAHFIVDNISFAGANYYVQVLDLENVTNGTIRSCTITHLAGYAIGGYALYLLQDSGITVTNLLAPDYGSAVFSSRDITISSSTLGGGSFNPSIDLQSSVNATLRSNALSTGVYLSGATSAQFVSHHIDTTNVIGSMPIRYFTGCAGLTLDRVAAAQILVAGCDGVRISNETLTGTFAPLQIAFTKNLTVDRNNLSLGTYGLLANDVVNATITHNEMLQEQGISIFLEASSHVTVYGNDLDVSTDSLGSDDHWNASYPEGGNFWAFAFSMDLCHGPLQDNCTGGDGFGDSPYVVGPDTVDAYPARGPFGFADTPPVPVFTWYPQPLPAGQIAQFEDTGSQDPDGSIAAVAWLFPSGGLQYGSGVATTTFPQAGVYDVTLTLWDNDGAIGQLTQAVTVSPPATYPRPVAVISRPVAYLGDVITFDASNSTDSYGTVVSYAWSFGDGSASSAAVATHAYAATGNYTASLVVTNDRGYASTASYALVVLLRPVLVPYADPEGFRLLVPQDWTVEHNVTLGNTTVGLVLLGPTVASVRTNLVGSSIGDPAAQETHAYTIQLEASMLAGVQQQYPDASLLGAPTFETVGDHSAIFFTLTYAAHPYTQQVLVIVSAAHQRDWTFVLTEWQGFRLSAQDTFWAMLAGFAITLPPVTSALVIVAVAGFAAAAVVILVVVFAFRTRRAPVVGAASVTCASCGAPLDASAKFCGRCGASQTGPWPPRP
jgi:hypothetical protein